jgi:hypothetical protein
MHGKKEQSMSSLSLYAAAFLLAAALMAPAHAQILDQEQTLGPYSFNGDATWARWQQGITVGIAGQLVGIEIWAHEEGGRPVGDAEVYINVGPPWQYDPHDFEILFDPPGPGWTYIDTSSANLSFNVDDQFVIGVQGIQRDFWFRGSSPSPGGPYPRGELWFEESSYSNGEYDMAFRTWVRAGCVGDLNGDGNTDLADLGILLGDFGCTP